MQCGLGIGVRPEQTVKGLVFEEDGEEEWDYDTPFGTRAAEFTR